MRYKNAIYLALIAALISSAFLHAQNNTKPMTQNGQSSQSYSKLNTVSTDTATNATNNERYPAINEYVDTRTAPSFNAEELQKKVIYPQDGFRARIEGQVFVRVLVGKDGYPVKAQVLRSDSRLFDESAIDAVMNIKYEPATDQDGKPVSSWLSIPVTFKVR